MVSFKLINTPFWREKDEERDGEKEEEEEEEEEKRRVLRLRGKHKLTVWERGNMDERFSIFIKEQTSLGQETSPAEERRFLDLSKCLPAVQKAPEPQFSSVIGCWGGSSRDTAAFESPLLLLSNSYPYSC